MSESRQEVLRDFYRKVCDRAEAKMLATGKLEGSHYAAMQEILSEEGVVEKESDTIPSLTTGDNPIRVFFSPVDKLFYASQNYVEREDGKITIAGKKYDVTRDIAAAAVDHELKFSKKADKGG